MGRTASLAERLHALREAVEAGADYLDPDVLDGPAHLGEQASGRLALGGEHTVVALAGATGSGKSSLFNALAGEAVAAVGVRRPTTGTAAACVWGIRDPDPLLDWLGVPRRHRLPAGTSDAALAGLVLLDLPDHDSVRSSHRVEVDRLVRVVDVLVWVLDPQKYADAAVHERYLAPLASHAEVMLVVLNQADRLSPADLTSCLADLRRLLAADGLPEVPVLPLSATAGTGVEELRRHLAERVASRRAALARLSADVTVAASALGRRCGPAAPDPVRVAGQVALVPALAAAAGVETVVSAVDRGYRHRAVAAAGWPPLRWLRWLRPDPVRRLRLAEVPGGNPGRTSLPAASAADRSRVALTVRQLCDAAAAGLPSPWPARIRDAAQDAERDLPDALDRAVAGVDVGTAARPRWWAAANAAQGGLLLLALAGAVWLLGLFAFSYLQLGSPPVPHLGRAPVPTLALLVGIGGGLLLALLARRLAALGARRRARAARRRLQAQVESVAELTVIAAIAAVLGGYARFCAAVGRAGGAPPPRGGRRSRS